MTKKFNLKAVILIYIGVALFTYITTVRIGNLEKGPNNEINKSVVIKLI
ncbi:MAG: hypothetical protein PHQ64_03035 [Bacilli bacterium]|nr:hypothetical protein [Bacilli bacterium]